MEKLVKIGLGLGLLAGSYFAYKRFISMKTSNNGINLLRQLEGSKNKAYKDSKGLWTIGVGHLIKPNEQHLLTKTLTESEINNLLKKRPCKV